MSPEAVERDPLVCAARWAYEHAAPHVKGQAERNLREARLRVRQRALASEFRVIAGRDIEGAA